MIGRMSQIFCVISKVCRASSYNFFFNFLKMFVKVINPITARSALFKNVIVSDRKCHETGDWKNYFIPYFPSFSFL